jgi:hypothetical protein
MRGGIGDAAEVPNSHATRPQLCVLDLGRLANEWLFGGGATWGGKHGQVAAKSDGIAYVTNADVYARIIAHENTTGALLHHPAAAQAGILCISL